MRLVTEEKVAIEGDRLLVVVGERLMMLKVEFIGWWWLLGHFSP